jgi:hypothetical protein
LLPIGLLPNFGIPFAQLTIISSTVFGLFNRTVSTPMVAASGNASTNGQSSAFMQWKSEQFEVDWPRKPAKLTAEQSEFWVRICLHLDIYVDNE